MEEENKRNEEPNSKASEKEANNIEAASEASKLPKGQAYTFLCIHGYQQSDTLFDKRIKVLTKHLLTIYPKSRFIFPKGPHLIDPTDIDKPEEERKYGWLFFNRENKLDYAEGWKKEKQEFDGWQESFPVLKKSIEENQKIDAIIAFSQGGLVSSILLVLQREGQLGELLKDVKCILNSSGVGSPIPENFPICHDYALGNKKIEVPCLGVMGRLDDHVENWRTEKLLNYYGNVETYVHEGKHLLPCKKPDLEIYTKFFQKYLL